MKSDAAAYSVPQPLEPDLARLLAYWEELIRAESSMPFSDDINVSQVPELAGRIVLMAVFENPQRFRFELAGDQVVQWFGAPLNGMFSDEVRRQGPLEEFTEQCRATVAQRCPTYHRSSAPPGGKGYSRILLPTWGDGHVALLLGGIAEADI